MLSVLLSVCLMLPASVFGKQFSLTSPSLENGKTLDNKHVYNNFGCEGENISPELNWNNAPKDTQSFAVTVFDPDAPTGSGFWHWTIFNIPKDVTSLAEGAGNDAGELPQGAVQGRTDFGKAGYGGACPPKGNKPHRYIFTLYALKTPKIELDSEASGALVGFYLNQYVLAKTALTVKYGR